MHDAVSILLIFIDSHGDLFRLTSELDALCVAYANPATSSPGEIPRTSHQNGKTPPYWVVSFW